MFTPVLKDEEESSEEHLEEEESDEENEELSSADKYELFEKKYLKALKDNNKEEIESLLKPEHLILKGQKTEVLIKLLKFAVSKDKIEIIKFLFNHDLFKDLDNASCQEIKNHAALLGKKELVKLIERKNEKIQKLKKRKHGKEEVKNDEIVTLFSQPENLYVESDPKQFFDSPIHLDQLDVKKQKHELKKKFELDSIRFSRTVEMTSSMLHGFQSLFNPPEHKLALSLERDPNIVEQAIGLIVNNFDSVSSLLTRAFEFINESSLTNSELKSSEYQTLVELIVRIGMQKRPQYFTSLENDESESDEDGFSVVAKFLREFIQEGALDVWLLHTQEVIKETEANESNRIAYLEFINAIGKLLKYIFSDAVNDPAQDPLNKYVEPKDIKYAMELKKWLECNQGRKDYNKFHDKFMEIDELIKLSRERVLKESIEYMFSLLKRMQPELSEMGSMDDVSAYQKKKGKAKKHQEFKDYVLSEYGKLDIFEPNQLRAFWENLQRHQYGKVCYTIVCESFDEWHRDSQVHQIVQQVWAVSHLDTIHHQPQEARSRMPGASVDGRPAPNFGYAMARSDAYQKWITNPLVRANGDIIMDAFHFVVDFGCELEVGEFLKRLNQDLSDRREDQIACIKNPHEYDNFMTSFEFYLLEKIFHIPFVSGNNGTVTGELKKAAGTKTNLLEKAEQALNEFKNFSTQMFALRPLPYSEKDKFDTLGPVFGIGFNGKRFDSPNHSKRDDNEIWLSFSNVGRNMGGYLLLSFIKYVAKYSQPRLTSVLEKKFTINAQSNFDKYRCLIRQHLNGEIKSTYEMLHLQLDAHMRTYMKEKRDKFEGFMVQLELGIPFDKLDFKFKSWTRNASNWYRIPHDVDVQIPDEMPLEEYEAQELARKLLFDALTRRPFSTEYPTLMPSLFLHWKNELLTFLSVNNSKIVSAIQGANKLIEIPKELMPDILNALDSLVWRVDPELKLAWKGGKHGIDKKFQTLQQENRIALVNKALDLAEKKVKNIQKNLQKAEQNNLSSLSIPNMEDSLNKAHEELKQAKQKKQELPKQPSELSQEDYKKFRDDFFKARGVSQCVEPVFARVLGHDRFFSIHISKKVGKTNIKDGIGLDHLPLQLGNRIPQDVITPCDKGCQRHALGHLYVGDMLSYQSADQLDQMRHTHGLGEVPDRLMTLQRLKKLAEEFQKQNEEVKKDEMEQAQITPNTTLPQYSQKTTSTQKKTEEGKEVMKTWKFKKAKH